MTKPKSSTVLLIFILILAALVRYWGINFGLPHWLCRPDEEIIAGKSLSFLTGDLNPRWFIYPTFYMYIVSSFYLVYFIISFVAGSCASMPAFLAGYFLDPSNFYIISRMISAFMGTATVLVVYRITEELFDKKTALVAALFLGCTYLHVRESHFGVTDIPMAFFIMLAFLFIVKSYKTSRLKHYIFSGIFTGLAISTKYLGGILVVPMAITHIFNIFKEGLNARRIFFDKRIISFGIVMIMFFFAGTPFAFFDWINFIADNVGSSQFLSIKGNPAFNIAESRNWIYQLKVSLFFGMGWPLLLSSIIGLAVLFRRDVKKALLVSSFPVAYYCYLGGWYATCVRYSVPIVPFLCITAALFFTELINVALKKAALATRCFMIPFLILILLYPSLYNIFQFDRLLTAKDNRLIASEWFSANVKRGCTIYQTGVNCGKLLFYPSFLSLHNKRSDCISSDRAIMAVAFKKPKGFFEHIDMRSYEELSYDFRKGDFLFRGNKVAPPDYIVISQSPLRVCSFIPRKIGELIEKEYYLKKDFKVLDMENRNNIYNQRDAFYLPFAGFKDIERPGPNIYIYERKDITGSS